MGATSDLLMRILVQDKATPGLKQAQRSVNDFGKAIGGVNKVLGVFGVALSAGAIVNGIANLTRLGAEADVVGRAFENMTARAGTSSQSMLAEMRSASRGTVSELAMMQNANRAMLLGGEQMFQKLPQLVEMARAASMVTGQSMEYMLDSIVLGIGRRSRLILDNLGIIVDFDKANQNLAQSLGKTVQELTEEEQITAALNTVLSRSAEYIKAAGAESVTTKDKIEQLTAAWQDLKTEVGEGIVLAITTSVDGSGDGNFVSNWASGLAALNRLKQDTLDTIRKLPINEQANAMERYKNIVRGLEGVGNVDDILRGFNNELRSQIGLLPYASMLIDAYALSTSNLTKLLQKTTVEAGASYAGLPSYIADTMRTPGEQARMLGDLEDWRTAGKNAADAWQNGYREQISAAQSMAQSALGARMSPTAGDFLSTAAGTYQNAPLESVRRLDAIIARGFAEIRAHADWASVLKIPDDVLAGSEAGLKAWATDTRDAAAALARPDLVDWGAFLNEFKRLQQEQAGKQIVMDIAMGKVKEAGLMGNDAQTKQMLLQMFGLDTPETQALALGEALNKAFTASDPAGIYLNAFKGGTDQNRKKIDDIRAKLEAVNPDGKAAAEKFLKDYYDTIRSIAANGGYVPPGVPVAGPVGGGYVLP